jgi:hypothetical protein
MVTALSSVNNKSTASCDRPIFIFVCSMIDQSCLHLLHMCDIAMGNIKDIHSLPPAAILQ